MECTGESLRGMLCLFIIISLAGTVEADNPNDQSGEAYYSSGISPPSGACPSWFEIHERNGFDGGQLTIELDVCQIPEYEVYTRVQNAGAGHIADLEQNDLIIVWDEDSDHGSNESNKNFDFTGSYVADPNCDYVKLSTTDSRTNWAIYRVTSGGRLKKESDGTNEHEAIHIGYGLIFTKTDDVSEDPNFATCVYPDDEITYTLCWDNTSNNTFEDAYIIDYLPIEVDYEFVFDDPNYSWLYRTYTWELGTIDPNNSPNDSGCVSLTVTVNKLSEPGQYIHNVAELRTGDPNMLTARAVEDTLVCCWGETIVYVDKNAAGLGTGTSWRNAYIDLQDALERIDETGCGDEVWVTGGTFSPGDLTTDTFTVPDGVAVYGGLLGNEASSYDPNSRELILQKSILTGLIRMEGEEEIKNENVVTMGNYTKLHGFTVEEAGDHGIYGNDIYGNDERNFSIYRSIIKDNGDTGIRCTNGTVKVRWCIIRDNIEYGIYHSNGGLLHIKNSDVFDNGWNGIYTNGSNAFIINSNIHHNGWRKRNNYDNGIRIDSPGYKPTVRNCTIMRNEGYGIYFTGNSAKKPEIYNCIFYNNNYYDRSAHAQFFGDLTAHYSSVTDPCDPNSNDCTEYGDYNMKCDPKFAYLLINDHNLHLAADSPCIEAGDNTDIGSTEVDIDAEDRIYDTDVDLGSDEVSCTDEIANELDWNGDGLVNNFEFATFGKAWLQYDPDGYTGSEPNDYINWNPKCDLDPNENGVIDVGDLAIFADSWLWQACWKDLEGPWMMAMAMGGSMEMEVTPPVLTIEEQIAQAEGNLDWLNSLWETDEEVRNSIDENKWVEMIKSLEESIAELEEEL